MESRAEMNSVVGIVPSFYTPLPHKGKNKQKEVLYQKLKCMLSGAGKTCLSSSELHYLYTCTAPYILSSICLFLLFLEW